MTKHILYLGLELPPHLQMEHVVHCPLIKVIPKPANDPEIHTAFNNIAEYTHLIFTSKSAVSIFFELLDTYSISRKQLKEKIIISVGQRTAQKLKENGAHVDIIASEETAEGIVNELTTIDLKNAHLFLPQSAISRNVIADWLMKHEILHTVTPIYNTDSNLPNPLPDLTSFNEIVFTSPSVVDAFIQGYGSLPNGIKLTCIGPITERKLFSFKKD